MNLASAVADLAVRIMPAEHRAWAEAARAELDHVPAPSALGFAIGGFATATRFRLVSPAFVLKSTRYGLAAAAFAWAVGAARLALHLRQANDPLPAAILLASAIIYGLGAVTTALIGLRATRPLIIPLLALVGTYAIAGGTFAPLAPNLAFYRALAVEDGGVLLTALLLASWALRYGERSAA